MKDNDEMNFSTEWGVHCTYPVASDTYDYCKLRSTAERMVKNITEADNGMTAELVWRGVTPWMKALI